MPDKSFPSTEAEVNLLFQTMAVQLPLVNGQLGLAQADVDFFIRQAINYQYVFNIAQEVSDQREAFTAWKRSIFEGDPSQPAPTPPTFPNISLPQAALNGLEAEAKAIIKRIKASAGYNETIGEQLGLVDSGPAPFNPNDLNPTLKLAAKSGNIVDIAFSKLGMDGMRVEFQRKSESVWQLAGIYLSSPATHNAASVPADEPEQRSYRAVCIKGNNPIGNYSPIYTVVTIP